MSWMKVKNKETYIPWVFTSGPQDQPFSPSIIQSCPTIAKILLWYKQNSSTLMSAEHLVGSMLSKTFKFVQLNARATSALLWNLNVMWLRPSIHARFLISLCCDLHWHVYAFFSPPQKQKLEQGRQVFSPSTPGQNRNKQKSKRKQLDT